MNTQLKFRQYIDNENNLMNFHYWGFIEGGLYVDKGFTNPMYGTGGITMEDAKSNSEQFLGFKDENDVDFYIGDIYALHTGKTATKKSTYFIGKIVKRDRELGYTFEVVMSKRDEKRKYAYGPKSNYRCSIIGNVHTGYDY